MSKSLEQIRKEFNTAISNAELALSDPVQKLNHILGGLSPQGGFKDNKGSAEDKKG